MHWWRRWNGRCLYTSIAVIVVVVVAEELMLGKSGLAFIGVHFRLASLHRLIL